MPARNTQTHYGGVSKAFHWLTALLILTLIPTGWYANQLPYETSEQLAQKAWLFSLHKTLGVAVFFVALLRILWALSQPKPGLLNAQNKLESFAAELVHWMLYGALVIVPLSGWIGHAAAAGFAPIWWPFGQGLPLVPKSTVVEEIAASVHFLATKVIILSVLLHIAGALKHQFVDRDATLRRMLAGTPVLPPLAQAKHSRLPVAVAGAIWVLVLSVSGAAGYYQALTHAASEKAVAADLAEVASDWQVQTGTLEISVAQFGSVVTGSFADWTADISFDPDAPGPQSGTVETIISIASLTLGSVSEQAMGADFFHADSFPTAVFKADLMKAPDGHVATGTLSIKEATLPLSLPFLLTIEGNTAQMRADLTLDRRDFGIGDNMADESSLGFDVQVKINLTATRPE